MNANTMSKSAAKTPEAPTPEAPTLPIEAATPEAPTAIQDQPAPAADPEPRTYDDPIDELFAVLHKHNALIAAGDLIQTEMLNPEENFEGLQEEFQNTKAEAEELQARHGELLAALGVDVKDDRAIRESDIALGLALFRIKGAYHYRGRRSYLVTQQDGGFWDVQITHPDGKIQTETDMLETQAFNWVGHFELKNRRIDAGLEQEA